jgi:hypothetical protein
MYRRGEIVMNKVKNYLSFAMPFVSILLLTILLTASAQAQIRTKDNLGETSQTPAATSRFRMPLGATSLRMTPTNQPANTNARSDTRLLPLATGAALPVVGSGTLGRLTKWTGFTSSNSTIGDSTIFEDKSGKVGIGTDTPTSPLTVQGVIETTLGGYKFPDGTLQTTAAITSIFHDASLTGNGTQASPLGVAPGGITTSLLASNAVTGAKIANGAVVRSLNGLFDNVQLAAGANITITPSGNTLTIAASNALTGVTHDTTLQGTGTGGSPLGLAVPLIFSGNVTDGNGVITVTNVAAGAPGVFAVGGNSSPTVGGGSGLIALGGSGNAAPGGAGLVSFGGNANGGSGGTGGSLIGGVGSNGGNGGDGLFAVGALGTGTGKKGGRGIVAIAGGGANGATEGLAGDFFGDVSVSGNLSKGGGSFKIDHPLDPENKYLYHSFVESPDMMNIYNGNITTDGNGEATVILPDWFEALNRDFRYQLTVVGTFAQAIVAEKVKGNRFTIKTNAPNVEVSWQVTGIRKDAYANQHRIPVEEMKPENERGSYLHPDAYGQPEERGVEWARNPELMQQMKETREQIKQKARTKNQ